MQKNRYPNASTEEKNLFTQFAKLIVLAGVLIASRVLEGTPAKGKFMFMLKKNNPGISHIEFVCNKAGEILRTRVVLIAVKTRTTLKSEFYKALVKLGTPLYGGIVVNFETADYPTEEILETIGKLIAASDEVDLTEPVKEEKVPEPEAEAEVPAPEVESPAEEVKAV